MATQENNKSLNEEHQHLEFADKDKEVKEPAAKVGGHTLDLNSVDKLTDAYTSIKQIWYDLDVIEGVKFAAAEDAFKEKIFKDRFSTEYTDAVMDKMLRPLIERLGDHVWVLEEVVHELLALEIEKPSKS